MSADVHAFAIIGIVLGTFAVLFKNARKPNIKRIIWGILLAAVLTFLMLLLGSHKCNKGNADLQAVYFGICCFLLIIFASHRKIGMVAIGILVISGVVLQRHYVNIVHRDGLTGNLKYEMSAAQQDGREARVIPFWHSFFTKIYKVDRFIEVLKFGDLEITLNGKCQIQIKNKKTHGHSLLNADLPYPERCDFVRYPGTNVVHPERLYDAWVLLIQSYELLSSDPVTGCDTRYKALIIRDDNSVFLNPKSNGGSGCPPIVRDRNEYTYLAKDFVNKGK